jgi:hypothetical protein
MPRPAKIRKDESQDLKEVAKQVAREAILEFNEQNDDEGPDDETLSLIDSTNSISEDQKNNDPTGFDIFADVGDPRTEKGDIIRYVIRKWGQHIATKFHPYSWEDLHEEFGPGNYQVIARSDSTKKFIKSESRILGDPRNASKKVIEEKIESSSHSTNASQGLGFMELFTLLQEQQKQAKEEARELSKEAQTTQNQMMILIAELLKTNAASGTNSTVQMMQMITQMMQQQQQATNQMFEKLAENQVKMLEKINEKIEKVTEKKSNDIEMLNKGFEMFSKMSELAEKKAQLQLELLEEAKLEAKNEDDGSSKKKSLTDSLIEGILPVVSQALAIQQNPALAAQHQLAMQKQAMHRRQLQIAQSRRNKSDRQLQSGKRDKEIGNTIKNEKTKTTEVEENKKFFISRGSTDGQNYIKNSGLPSVLIGNYDSSSIQNLNFSDSYMVDGIKEKCKKLLPEFLGSLMMENVDAEEGAKKTIEMLKNNGITRQDFLKEVQIEVFLEEAQKYGLPDIAYGWLNDLYAHIQGQSRNDDRGEFTQSQQSPA